MSDTINNLIQAEFKFKELQALNKINSTAMDENIAITKEATMSLIVENHSLVAEKGALLNKIEQLMTTEGDVPPVVKPPIVEEAIVTPKLLFNKSQENQGWGDTILYSSDATHSTIKNQIIICGGRSGIINNKTLPFNINWENLTFLQGPYPSGWGAAMNKVSGTMKGCKFVSIGRRDWTKSQNFVDGHPTYFKPWKDVTFTDNYFIDCGGNVQFADRPWENEVPAKLKLDFLKNVWSNCSWNPTGHGGGGSFNLAVYCATDEGTEVNVKGCTWTNTITWIDFTNAKVNASARGCMTLWNEAFYPNSKWQAAGFAPDTVKHFSKAVIEECTVRTTYMDRAAFSFEGTREIIFKNLNVDFIDLPNGLDRPFILIDDKPANAQQAKYISIEPIGAPGFMRIKGSDYLLTEGYEYLEEGYTPSYSPN